MTNPPTGGTPDPNQPLQPYGQSYEPYPQDPYAVPPNDQPGGYPGGGQPYPGPYGPPPYAAYGPRTNALAVASLACSLAGLLTCISAPVGVVLGHLAKRQIRQTGEQGEGLATAGLWVGYIVSIGGILLAAAWLAAIIFALGWFGTTR